MSKFLVSIILCLCLALPLSACSSSSPKEEVMQKEEFTDVNMFAIDMTVLKVRETYYAVWSGWNENYVNEESPCQNLYIASMTFHPTKPYVRLGKRVLLSEPELPWELKVGEHLSLLEGPEVLCHDDDVFIVYSTRGSWTVHYKLGLLHLKSLDADPLVPSSWEKKSEPVFCGVQKSDNLGYLMYGVGHASFTMSPDDTEYWINYHSKTSPQAGWTDRKVFFQKFDFGPDGYPVFGFPADPSVPMARPAGEVAIEKSQGVACPSLTFTNPVRDGADPWIVKADGKYYTCKSGAGGIMVTESDYMTKFNDGKSYGETRVKVWSLPSDSADHWNKASLWAPEMHHINGKWYIFYAAGKQGSAPFWSQRAGVLISDRGPFGPYYESDDAPLFTGEILKK